MKVPCEHRLLEIPLQISFSGAPGPPVMVQFLPDKPPVAWRLSNDYRPDGSRHDDALAGVTILPRRDRLPARGWGLPGGDASDGFRWATSAAIRPLTESWTVRSANQPMTQPIAANASKLPQAWTRTGSVPPPPSRPRASTVRNAKEPRMPA